MIRETQGTIYLTADAFCDRYNFAKRGQQFSYASGDLAMVCELDKDACQLRALVLELEQEKKIALDVFPSGDPVRMQHLATKLTNAPAMYWTTPSLPTAPPNTSELAPEPECCDEPSGA